MVNTTGLRFTKVDLHVHSPASIDAYKASHKPTAKELVQLCLDKGLGAIAVTDHQTAVAVDEIKAAAAGTDLVVFPGVELMVAGGKSGIHINLIFDVDKTTEHIHQFLNSIKVFTKDGKPTVLAADCTVGKVSDELAVYDPTAIIILAHCHSTKGVTGDMQGEVRSHIFQPHRKNILAAEAAKDNFTDADLAQKHKRVVDLFDGTDVNYYHRRLGVIQASDAHELDQIGTTPCWLKVDEPFTIEDLRQCFIDRDTRIRQPFEFAPTLYPHIESLTVTSGFIKDQLFEFHEGLNSILGAKGSGKSLAIEALRFALDQSPTLSPIRDDHYAKLDKCVKPYGAINVLIVDESGKKYLVSRTYDPNDGNPTKILDVADGTTKTFALAEAFPVLFLSQNEIIRIAEDATGASLRRFIDRFFDFHHHQHSIEALTKDLTEADRRVAATLRAHLGLTEANKKAATLREEIQRLARQLQNAAFDKFVSAEAIGRAIRAQREFVTRLESEAKTIEGQYKERQAPAADGPTAADASVKRCIDAANAALDVVRAQFGPMLAGIAREEQKIEAEYRQWEAEFAPIKAAYETVVKDSGGTQVALDQRRRKLIGDLTAVERQITDTTAIAQGIRAAFEARRIILDNLDNAYKDYFQERQDRCQFFTKQSHGAIEVTISAGRDVSQFKSKLVGIKKGSYLKDDDIEAIVKAVTPRELIAAVLGFEFKGRTDKKPLIELATAKSIRSDVIERLANHMLDEMSYEALLGLMYESAPQDVPEISYQVGGTMKPLGDLSVGQKASALLIVGLSDGLFPIVIDQPEDSLDLRTIWDDVCSTIRGSKERRQFIFTTHNSSVAVASDSDKFTILEADASVAKILYAGSINSSNVRDEVIAYLEGGPETYEKKRTKYNIDRSAKAP